MSSLGDCLVSHKTTLEDTDLAGWAIATVRRWSQEKTVQGELVAANSHDAGKAEVARSLTYAPDAVVDYGRIILIRAESHYLHEVIFLRPAGFRALCSNQRGRAAIF